MKFSLSQIAELSQILKELSTGLNRLDLNENFISFQATVTIAAGATYRLRNELKVIPSKMLVVDQTGNGLLTRGILYESVSVANNLNYLYILNNGAVSVTAKVLYLK